MPDNIGDDFNIKSLADLEQLRGCEILNANVIMFLRYRINHQELVDILKNVREIIGFLKIYEYV